MSVIKIKPRYNPNWSIYEYATLCPPSGWESVFESLKDEFKDISEQLDQEVQMHGPYYPAKRDIFRALELVKPKDVRVVIIGMDPYPGEYNGQCYANGLAFSVDRNIPVDKIPASLKNVYKEVKSNYPNAQLNTGDLSSWANQGVLLINASLTVRPGVSGSHKKLWAGVVKAIISKVRENDNVVFVFWGKDAQKYLADVGNKCQKLSCGHPSPMSVKTFLGNQHFLKINNFFRHIGLPEIDWSVM
jgi:uracil-DNA glycosylase